MKPYHIVTAIVSVLSFALSSNAAIVVTGFSPLQWQTSDASLGLAGATIEDFEDVNLATGLQIQANSPGFGGYGPTNILPNTFDPRNVANGGNDNVGNAFEIGLWDGSHVLINRPDNRLTGTTDYGSLRWGDVTFFLPAGIKIFGVAIEQNSLSAPIIVNGVSVGSTGDFLTLTGGRNGYLRIEATGTDAISTVLFDNQAFDAFSTDGISFDHVAFSVPEPSSIALGLMGVAGIALLRNRRNAS